MLDRLARDRAHLVTYEKDQRSMEGVDLKLDLRITKKALFCVDKMQKRSTNVHVTRSLCPFYRLKTGMTTPQTKDI